MISKQDIAEALTHYPAMSPNAMVQAEYHDHDPDPDPDETVSSADHPSDHDSDTHPQ